MQKSNHKRDKKKTYQWKKTISLRLFSNNFFCFCDIFENVTARMLLPRKIIKKPKYYEEKIKSIFLLSYFQFTGVSTSLSPKANSSLGWKKNTQRTTKKIYSFSHFFFQKEEKKTKQSTCPKCNCSVIEHAVCSLGIHFYFDTMIFYDDERNSSW